MERFSVSSKELKRRLNSWWFRKAIDQIAYKVAWEGMKTIESKHTRGSLSTCPICGFKLVKYQNGRVECIGCGYRGGRHVVACSNLLRWESVVQTRPPCACSDEQKHGRYSSPLNTRRYTGIKVGYYPSLPFSSIIFTLLCSFKNLHQIQNSKKDGWRKITLKSLSSKPYTLKVSWSNSWKLECMGDG